MAFTGAPTSNGGEGVYLSQSGNLSVIADSSTTLPGSTAKLASAYFADSRNNINSERLLFSAFGNGTNGLYSREKNGSLIRIADNSMLAPGTNTPFRSFVDAQMSGNQIAFMNNAGGNDVGRGAYLSVNGVITTIANGTTQVPETDFLFKTVYEAALSEKRQVIAGRYSDGKRLRYGLYENTSNGLIPLLDPNTLLPPDANYTYLPARLLASDDTLAFSVYSQTPEGGTGFYEPLFVNRGGITEKLLQRGDTLDGKTVSFFYPLQFDSGRLLMQVSFTDNSRGYFSAQAVPEPGAVAWLIVVSMGGAGWKYARKRHQKKSK